MHPLLPQPPDPRHDRKIYLTSPTGHKAERGVAGRAGSINTIKIRAVCDRCNNGWMSQLEESVRPFLTPIITGAPIVLDFEQTALIARWVALKCIVAEHSQGEWMTPREDREAFREGGRIPRYFNIYMANHNMQNAAGYVRHTNCIAVNSPEPNPPLNGAAANIQTISFVLGRVFVHLNAARIHDFSLESRVIIPAFYANCRLWPLTHHEMVWPRRPLFSRESMAYVAATLTTYVGASTVHTS